jgi:hypothetical protein
MSEDRLKEKLDQGAYYDYNQLLKTLFFKLKMKKKETEYKELIKRALNDLNSHQ